MTAERWKQVKIIIEQVMQLLPEERNFFLNTACKDDAELRKEVEALLGYESRAKDFLHTPAINDYVDQGKEFANALINDNEKGKNTNMAKELIEQIIDEKYKIEMQLGQGGMGAVYKATHLGTNRPVALKVIMPQFMANPEFIERFKLEARATGKLRHPNIVNVTDFGFTKFDNDPLAYLVMEFLDGYNLRDFLKNKGKLPLALVVDLVEQICLAISEAHKQGIIHRDLKPDNIWLEPNGRGGYNVKVLDFGLAKLIDTSIKPSLVSELTGRSNYLFNNLASVNTQINTLLDPSNQQTTNILRDEEVNTLLISKSVTAGNIDPKTIHGAMTRVGTVLGTPLYMSPEQCSGKELDNRSDIYSLGVIVYQMLIGETPFTGDMFELISKHNQVPPPSLLAKRRDIPKSVEALILKSLAKNPDERPATVEAFATALRFNVEGEIPTIRQAINVYRNNFSLFLRTSALVYLPFLMLSFLPLFYLSSLTTLYVGHSPFASFLQKGGYFLLAFLLISFASSINIAACSLIVKDLSIFSSAVGGVRLLSLLVPLKQHLLTLTKTAIYNNIMILLGLFRLVVPGVKQYFDSSLYVPVVITEHIKGQSALARSRVLVERLYPIVSSIQVRDFFISIITPFIALTMFFVGGLLLDVLHDFIGQANLLKVSSWYVHTSNSLPKYIPVFSFIISAIFITLLHPIIAITTSMLYFKARQAGGEKLDEVLSKNLEFTKEPVRKNLFQKRAVVLLATMWVIALGWVFAKDNVLLWAVTHERLNVIKAAIYMGANINAKDSDGDTALIVGIRSSANATKQVNVFVLLCAGADVNMKGKKGCTPLQVAIEEQKTYHFFSLLKAGADVNAKNTNGETALMVALQHSNTYIVETLLKIGADVNSVKNDGYTVLDDVNALDSEKLKLLLSAGINPEMKNKDGQTPLMNAASRGLTDAIELLVNAGADVNAKDGKGNNVLSYAIKSGTIESVKALISAGAIADSKEEAILSVAVIGDTSRVKNLIASGVSPNVVTPKGYTNSEGNTPLMYAAQHGHIDTVEALVAAGANVNAKNKIGETALMYAASQANTYVVRVLIAAGTNVNENTERGETALMRAAFNVNADVVRILISAGADVSIIDKEKFTALHRAVNLFPSGSKPKSQIETVRALLESSINLKSEEYENILLFAVLGGNKDVMRMLLDAGVDVNAKDKYGYTVLEFAEGNGLTSTVEFLKEAGAKH